MPASVGRRLGMVMWGELVGEMPGVLVRERVVHWLLMMRCHW